MKLLFWIFVLLALSATLTAITGTNGFSTGGSGISIESATTTERVFSLFFAGLFAYGGYLLRKGGIHAWWVVTVLWISICLGLVSNILNAFNEGIAFLLWILITQMGSAAVGFYYWFKWWLPKKAAYKAEEQT